ncbi:MAG: bifunctional DNA-formamidopyrimidine glycosylase/DNA-(apurinic or apyrimidinic site) lyase [Candidatus Hodarchaeales archaeon]|jgi:formamidopyrimidine-DNA glycosylase
MPEGPEVESVRQELLTQIKNRVKQIQLTPLSQKYPKYQDKESSFEPFRDKIIKDIFRYGKFLVWIFDRTDKVILNHLGMSGKWCFCEDLSTSQSDITHPKVIIQMERPPHLIFDDTRNFGQFKVFQTCEEVMNYPPIKSLGIDGLEIPFPLNEFISRISNKRYEDKIIGELLLNQRLVAGVGNIYKAEALFQAKIHPLRIVKSLSKADKNSLGIAISEVLHKALKDLGSSIDTRYVLPSGSTGNAQLWHNAYNRKGKECKICGTEIEKITQKDRSTFFCPKCQK